MLFDNADLLESTEHLLAGHALFTAVMSEEERYTYSINTPKQGKYKGRTFVRLLTGPNNTNDYQLVGEVQNGILQLTGKMGHGVIPNSVALIRWLVHLANIKSPTPEGLKIYHAGQCLHCGRVLTVPFPDNPYRKLGL